MKQFFVPLRSFLIFFFPLITASAGLSSNKRATKNIFFPVLSINPKFIHVVAGLAVPDRFRQCFSRSESGISAGTLNLPDLAAAAGF